MSDEFSMLREKVASLESRLSAIETQAAPTMDTKAAMARLGYKSGTRFWQAVRRVGIPFSRLSARQCMFRTSDIDAALERRKIGNGKFRRIAA